MLIASLIEGAAEFWWEIAEEVRKFHEFLGLCLVQGKSVSEYRRIASKMAGRIHHKIFGFWLFALIGPLMINTLNENLGLVLTLLAGAMKLPLKIPSSRMVELPCFCFAVFSLVGDTVTWKKIWEWMEDLAKNELYCKGKKLVEYGEVKKKVPKTEGGSSSRRGKREKVE